MRGEHRGSPLPHYVGPHAPPQLATSRFLKRPVGTKTQKGVTSGSSHAYGYHASRHSFAIPIAGPTEPWRRPCAVHQEHDWGRRDQRVERTARSGAQRASGGAACTRRRAAGLRSVSLDGSAGQGQGQSGQVDGGSGKSGGETWDDADGTDTSNADVTDVPDNRSSALRWPGRGPNDDDHFGCRPRLRWLSAGARLRPPSLEARQSCRSAGAGAVAG